jgi:Fic family protein
VGGAGRTVSDGRIARALSDLMLSRADKTHERYYSMSSQILIERKKYYSTLQNTQHSNGDITPWIEWFLQCLKNALLSSETSLQKVLRKNEFWEIHEKTSFNARQRKVLVMLLDGFEGNLTTTKWAKICKCSEDTALRDITRLMELDMLKKTNSGGRSTSYELVV